VHNRVRFDLACEHLLPANTLAYSGVTRRNFIFSENQEQTSTKAFSRLLILNNAVCLMFSIFFHFISSRPYKVFMSW
jgi:hypothetical protein